MSNLSLSLAQTIAFVMVDSSGVEVTGLGSGFTLFLSKNGGAFVASTGTKAEVGSGWYTYGLTAAETDIAGPLAVKVTGAGAVQSNLVYQVVGSAWQEAVGTNILTTEEAATVLRCGQDDANMLMLLPAIDEYIQDATGHDWTADSPITDAAKAAARMLLVLWHENPGMTGQAETLNYGLRAVLTQLEAKALRYKEFEGNDGAGSCSLAGARVGDSVTSLVGLIGSTGSQAGSFESVITVADKIQQTASSDLTGKFYRVLLTPVSAL